MKEGRKTNLYIKIVICLLVVVFIALAGMSFSAYTSFNSEKRVVSTTGSGETRFSSNYLSLTNINDYSYLIRKITPSRNQENNTLSFNIHVCNYVFGDANVVNTKDVIYKFSVKVLSRTGELTSDISSIKVYLGHTEITKSGDAFEVDGQKLPKKTSDNESGTMHIFTINGIPQSLENQIKFEITATPTRECLEATNNNKLAANIVFTSLTPYTDWTGKFIDNKSKHPSSYDGFNYEISGQTGKTVTLEVDSKLKLSKWFLNEIGYEDEPEVSDGKRTYTFASLKDAYQFQIYYDSSSQIKYESSDNNQAWSTLEGLISVSSRDNVSNVQN